MPNVIAYDFKDCDERLVTIFMDRVFALYFGLKNSKITKQGTWLSNIDGVHYHITGTYENIKGEIECWSHDCPECDLTKIRVEYAV